MKITSIKQQKRDTGKVNLYIDDEFLSGISKDLLIEFDLFIGKEISEQEKNKIISKSERIDAYNKSLRLIAKRARSIKEISDYLKHKKYNVQTIEDTIKKLEDKSYINDYEFAKLWVRARNEFKPKGRIALRAELETKGVDKLVINSVLDSVDNELEQALLLTQKKLETVRENDILKKKRKISDFLQRRGYNWQIIKDVFKKLKI